MTQVKQVVQWKPAKVEIKDKSGKVSYVGKFRTKVQEGTPGAIRHTGSNPAGRSWDYFGQDVDSIAGQCRWIDVRTTDFGPTISIFLESPKALHQITVPYDVNNIHTILNHFLGLGKELEVAYLNVSYWVRRKLDVNKNPKLDKDGNVLWARDLSFRDVPVKWDFEEWKDYAEKNNLQWFKETRAAKQVWNFEAELNFWLSQVVKVQRFFLSTEKCLPFCWNSVTASASDGTALTLTTDEIASISAIYDGIRPLYDFKFGRNDVNADNVELVPSADYVPNAPAPQPERIRQPDGFPTVDVNSYEDNRPDTDPLPF